MGTQACGLNHWHQLHLRISQSNIMINYPSAKWEVLGSRGTFGGQSWTTIRPCGRETVVTIFCGMGSLPMGAAFRADQQNADSCWLRTAPRAGRPSTAVSAMSPSSAYSKHPQLLSLKAELALRLVDGDFVFAAPTSRAVLLARHLHAIEHALQRQVRKRIDFQEITHLIHRAIVRDQFLAGGEIDAIKTGMADRGAGNAKMNLFRPGPADGAHLGARGGAAHDRVLDDHDPFALDHIATARSRAAWPGRINVRPTNRLGTIPSSKGIFDSLAKPNAALRPESGMGMTESASTGACRANSRPIATRTMCTFCPKIRLAGLAKYTCSNTQWARSGTGTSKNRLEMP